MKAKLFIIIILGLFCSLEAAAESWDYIRTSGEFYYGVGVGATEDEANNAALADLISQIATQVSSDFVQIDDVTNSNNGLDHKTRVLNCVKTYSQATLTNTQKMEPKGKSPKITARIYIKKSELARIFDNRVAKAKNMLFIAEECLENKKIDMALQYYYWAYSLIRSVQFPNEVKDERDRIIVDWIPIKIDQILSDIDVCLDKKEGDCVDLFFKYKDKPVSSLEFSYSDGRTVCQGLVKDGRGMMEMIPGYKTDAYHLDIEYEYKEQARGDSEMESVLGVITPKVLPKASIVIDARNINTVASQQHNNVAPANQSEDTKPLIEAQNNKNDVIVAHNSDIRTTEVSSQNYSVARQSIDGIIDAFVDKNYSEAHKYFTSSGLEMFNRLTGYGKARILDTTKIRYYKGLGGRTVVRGLKMSFSFDGARKKTFVEDISFTFNNENKIENVAFGLGDIAESDIFNSGALWTNEVREIIVSFMENYKTAYSLERIDYISDIFADDAVIIIGHVAKRFTANAQPLDKLSVSIAGENLIKYNHFTKVSYIERLRSCFNRNDFINLRFTNHQIQWLEKFEDQTLFAINIRQEYNSSTYADDGYLFLLVDMTNPDEPSIKVRTWQPNEVRIDKLYNAGDFFKD